MVMAEFFRQVEGNNCFSNSKVQLVDLYKCKDSRTVVMGNIVMVDRKEVKRKGNMMVESTSKCFASRKEDNQEIKAHRENQEVTST